MLELLYMSTKTVTFGVAIPKAIYLASWDGVLYNDTTYSIGGSDFRKFFKDGTSFAMGQAEFTGQYLSAEGGRGAAKVYSYIHDDGYYDQTDVAMLDEVSGLPLLGQTINRVDMTGKVNDGSFIDHMLGLAYTPGTAWNSQYSAGGWYYQKVLVYSLTTGALVRTLDIPYSTGVKWSSMWARLHYVDGASLLMCAWKSADGRIVVFDRETGKLTFSGLVNHDNRAIVYDSTHHVLIVLLSSGQVAVYALNNVGYALSAPSLSPAPALYTLSRVKTRLTSASGQGVPSQGVLWYLSGDKGALEKPYSLTDADGYAENWYYGPAGSFGLGSETINVEVSV